MRVVKKNDESSFTDADLIDLLRKSHNGIMDIIYYKHKDSAIRFMKKRYDDEDIIMDVYLESMTAIYKNILNPDFKLTTDFQGYINTVCEYQLLNAIKKEQKQDLIKRGEFIIKKQKKISEEHQEFNDVFRSLRPNIHKGQTEEADEGNLNIENIDLFNRVLNKMKVLSTKCQEIISRTFLQEESNEQVAEDMGYKDKIGFKNYKSRCLKELRLEALKIKIHS
jgi:RNA polymerase sigma factor (sigma-70 family)